jgi:hypothetical protein
MGGCHPPETVFPSGRLDGVLGVVSDREVLPAAIGCLQPVYFVAYWGYVTDPDVHLDRGLSPTGRGAHRPEAAPTRSVRKQTPLYPRVSSSVAQWRAVGHGQSPESRQHNAAASEPGTLAATYAVTRDR